MSSVIDSSSSRTTRSNTPRDLSARLNRSGLEVPENAIWMSAAATAWFLSQQRPRGSSVRRWRKGHYDRLHEVGYTRTDVSVEGVINRNDLGLPGSTGWRAAACWLAKRSRSCSTCPRSAPDHCRTSFDLPTATRAATADDRPRRAWAGEGRPGLPRPCCRRGALEVQAPGAVHSSRRQAASGCPLRLTVGGPSWILRCGSSMFARRTASTSPWKSPLPVESVMASDASFHLALDAVGAVALAATPPFGSTRSLLGG